MVIFGYSQNHLSRPLATQINIKSSKTWKLTVKYLVFIFLKDKSLPNTIRFSALSLTQLEVGGDISTLKYCTEQIVKAEEEVEELGIQETLINYLAKSLI